MCHYLSIYFSSVVYEFNQRSRFAIFFLFVYQIQRCFPLFRFPIQLKLLDFFLYIYSSCYRSIDPRIGVSDREETEGFVHPYLPYRGRGGLLMDLVMEYSDLTRLL